MCSGEKVQKDVSFVAGCEKMSVEVMKVAASVGRVRAEGVDSVCVSED